MREIRTLEDPTAPKVLRERAKGRNLVAQWWQRGVHLDISDVPLIANKQTESNQQAPFTAPDVTRKTLRWLRHSWQWSVLEDARDPFPSYFSIEMRNASSIYQHGGTNSTGISGIIAARACSDLRAPLNKSRRSRCSISATRCAPDEASAFALLMPTFIPVHLLLLLRAIVESAIANIELVGLVIDIDVRIPSGILSPIVADSVLHSFSLRFSRRVPKSTETFHVPSRVPYFISDTSDIPRKHSCYRILVNRIIVSFLHTKFRTIADCTVRLYKFIDASWWAEC